jgi:hypothetical protein
MACSKLFSFAEIVQGRDSSVRVTDDGLLYAVDLAMVVTGKNRDDSGKALRNISDETFLSVKFTDKNTGGSGSSKTKLVSFEHAIELIMVLPGKVAKETRAKFANIIRRYLAGDKSLIVEINANAASTSPIAQLARGGPPPADPVEDHDARRKRIKREDLEILQMEQDIQEKRIKNVNSFMCLMNTIRPDWMQTDARFRLQTEDTIKNILVPSAPALTNGETAPSQTASLSISQLVQELGGKPLKHADACRVGALAAKRYRAAHDADPPKHAQWVDGAERAVNSYTEEDRGLLTAVLQNLGLVKQDE